MHSAILTPAHGVYVGASSRPFGEHHRKPGDRVGANWRIPREANRRPVRHLVYDTNYWKSFVHARFKTADGDPGCLSLWGRDASRHGLFADHLTAEYYVRTSGRNREVDEWKQRPDKPDNHWLDCMAGCVVAASIQGAAIAGQVQPRLQARSSKPKMKLSEIQRLRRERGDYARVGI